MLLLRTFRQLAQQFTASFLGGLGEHVTFHIFWFLSQHFWATVYKKKASIR